MCESIIATLIMIKDMHCSQGRLPKNDSTRKDYFDD